MINNIPKIENKKEESLATVSKNSIQGGDQIS